MGQEWVNKMEGFCDMYHSKLLDFIKVRHVSDLMLSGFDCQYPKGNTLR